MRIVYDRPHESDSYPDISKEQSTGSDNVTSAYPKIETLSKHDGDGSENVI